MLEVRDLETDFNESKSFRCNSFHSLLDCVSNSVNWSFVAEEWIIDECTSRWFTPWEGFVSNCRLPDLSALTFSCQSPDEHNEIVSSKHYCTRHDLMIRRCFVHWTTRKTKSGIQTICTCSCRVSISLHVLLLLLLSAFVCCRPVWIWSISSAIYSVVWLLNQTSRH